ncbi:MAG: hypothetical protein KJO07_12220, partial [Deltaproteobacteria bacterium]|nr:hypothetical protein [Deltaproteobacteria bacterium]
IENPEFEKAKLEQVRAWKAERVATARFFSSKESKISPLLAGYQVEEGDKIRNDQKHVEDPSKRSVQIIDQAKKHLAPPDPGLDRARRAFAGNFEGWANVQLTPKFANKIPAVDGIRMSDAYELYSQWSGYPEAVAPIPGKLALYNAAWMASFDAAKPVTIADVMAAKAPGCKVKDKARFFYFQPPRVTEGKQSITDLLIVACGQAAERDGYYGFGSAQLLQYDQNGRLVALYDSGSVTVLSWSDEGKLSGGKRLRNTGSFLRTSSLMPRAR